MGKSVKKARKETEELRASVRGMLQDRLDRGAKIPASARKRFPKLKARTVGKKIGKKTSSAVKSRAQKNREALDY